MPANDPDRYVVIGNPISHSKSPFIHTHFARQTGQVLDYSALHVEEGDFPRAVREFFSGGGLGANVTMPFKQQAWELAASLTQQAQLAEAVNTLSLDAVGALLGHNTDGLGLVRDIKTNQEGQLQGKNILVAGAGGAVRGILLSLLNEKPAQLTLANRTVEKAQALARRFSPYGPVQACRFEELPGQQFQWLINATSASLHDELPPLPDSILAPDCWCCDLVYGKEQTVFCRWAQAAGAAKVFDGLGMLVEQAAESFMHWRGVRPATAEVIAQLRNDS